MRKYINIKKQNPEFLCKTPTSINLDTKYKKILLYIIAILPPLVYMFLVARFAVNIPFKDDFGSILAYLNLPASKHLKLDILIGQVNEHRILSMRLISKIIYSVKGTVDFWTITFVGNFALLGIAGCIVYIFKKNKIAFSNLVPIMFLLFAPQSLTNITHASGVTTHVFALFFGVLALLLWNEKSLICSIFALLAAFFAMFTFGNGMMLFFIFIIWTIIELIHILYKKSEEKNLIKNICIKLSLAVLFGTICIIYFFTGYIRPDYSISLANILKNSSRILLYIMLFLGSYMNFFIPALVVGIATSIFFIFLTAKCYYYKRPTIYFFLLYLFFTPIIASITRLHFGIDQALSSSRYRIYSILTLVFCLIAFIDLCLCWFSKYKRPVFIFITICALLFNVISLYKAFPLLTDRRERIIEGMRGWTNGNASLGIWDQEEGDRILKESIRLGIYKIPEFITSSK